METIPLLFTLCLLLHHILKKFLLKKKKIEADSPLQWDFVYTISVFSAEL